MANKEIAMSKLKKADAHPERGRFPERRREGMQDE